MFTGIITHQGLFCGYRRARQELLIEAPGLAGKIGPGDSVSVDGVCLSLLGAEKGELRFNLSQETTCRTTLGALKHHDRSTSSFRSPWRPLSAAIWSRATSTPSARSSGRRKEGPGGGSPYPSPRASAPFSSPRAPWPSTASV